MQEATPVAPPPPPQAGVTISRDAGGRLVVRSAEQTGANPTAIYRAAQNKREVLGDQMSSLTNRREDLARQLRQQAVDGADKAGLEKQISELDGRIGEVGKQIAQADLEVAQAAGIPGVVMREPQPPRSGPPEEVFVLGGIFIFVVMMPLAVGYARRLWKRAAVVSALPAHFLDRFARLEQAVDSIAIEVERQGEGQRFLTKLFSEQGPRALGQGAAQPVEMGAKEPVASRRGSSA